MKVLLLQLDGKLPNIALMRLSAHHKARGDSVELRRTGQPENLCFGDSGWDRIYASAIFERTRPVCESLLRVWPDAIVGGTGWDVGRTLEHFGVTALEQDYSAYPGYSPSIGFTQRGCRLRCGFCVVPRKEGAIREEQTINDLWRGDPWPRNLVLLDNDFFGQPDWESRVSEIVDGNFQVSFNQGINVRFITDEAAKAIGRIRYMDDGFRTRRIYTAWDNRKDESRLFAGLDKLCANGVKPDHIMVYMLIGYWPGETEDDWLYRSRQLRNYGCRPYPMPYVRTRESVGFQRWVVGAYDKRVPWDKWKSAQFQPYRLGNGSQVLEMVMA